MTRQPFKPVINMECGPIEYNNIEYNTEKLKKFFGRDSTFWTEFKAQFRSEKKDFDEEEDKNYEANLKALSKILGKNNTQKIVEKAKSYKIGRLYPEAKQSCVTLPRVIANYLVGDKLDDADIQNCHANIFNQLIKYYVSVGKLNYGCPELEEYAGDRKAVLEKYGFTKGDFMSVMYDSNFIRNKNGTPLVNPLTTSINRFLMNEFYKLISEEHASDLKAFITQRKAKMRSLGKPPNYNIEGACLSIIAQTYERTISVQIEHFLKNNYDVPRCMVYDGFYVCKSVRANGEILAEIEKHVKNTTGFDIKLLYKEVRNEAFEIFMDKHEKLVKGEYTAWKEKWEVNHFYSMKNKGEIVCDYYQDMHIYPCLKEVIEKYVHNNDFMEMFGDGSMFKLWMADKTKRSYKDFDFYPPPLVCPPHIYNTWKGYERSKRLVEYTEEEGIEIWNTYHAFKDHLASGDEKVRDYMIRLDAHIVHSPGTKTGTLRLAKSEVGGVGKGTDNELVCKLIGDEYYILTDNTDQILGKFTSGLERKIVVVLDEADPVDMRSKLGALKSLTTNINHRIEHKGEKARQERSCVNIFINTNNDNAIKIDNGDRRMYVIEPELMTNEQIKDVRSLMNDDRKVQILFQKLSKYECQYETMKDWQENRPITVAYLEMQNHCLDNRYSFFHKYVTEKTQEKLNAVKNDDLFVAYKAWCEQAEKMSFTMESLVSKISKIKGVGIVKIKKVGGKACRVRFIDRLVVLESMKKSKTEYFDHAASMFGDLKVDLDDSEEGD